MSRRALRVLVLDDSAADAELVLLELERLGKVTAERVNTRERFEQALHDLAPQVVISDHSLAMFDTEEALRMVQAVRPSVPFIVVSGTIDVRSVVRSIRAGAEDIVLKNELSRLPTAIEAAFSARKNLSTLSPRQLEVLRMVAQGLTTPAIAERLHLSVKTVETHRGQVMKRLGIHDLARLVRYAVRVGLVPPQD